MKFAPEIIDEIKSYVYIYTDPNTEEIFYIGKGQGNRCFEHLDEESESNKVQKIQELKQKNQTPIIELLRYGLTDNEASLIESTLIDYVGIENLTNKVRGLHSNSFGRMTINDIILKYNADEIEVNDDVIAITINKLYYSKISEEELFDNTKGMWKVGERRNKAKYAFAVFQGVVREVYEITQWYEAGTLEYKGRDSSTFNTLGRYEFDGKKANQQIGEKYVNKSIRNYITKGSQNPIKYINC